MQNRWISMVLIVSVAMNAAFIAVAGYGYFRNRSMHAKGASHLLRHGHHHYEALELTQTQLKEMAPIATLFHEQLDHLHDDMEIKKKAMINVLRDEKPGEKQVDALRKEMAAIQDRIQATVIAHILDVKAILDSGQQEHFFELLNESMSKDPHMFIPAGAK
jgi:Spy/CpxP family protein refolding chaperone